MASFSDFGLAPALMNSIGGLGYSTPTPIQIKAIPHILAGRDVMGLAQTGTGKTAAFGLPLIDQLLQKTGKPEPKTTKSLILAPTRELANQIAVNLKTLVFDTPLRVTTVVGGVSIGKQCKALLGGTDILVATPGRLLDLIDRRAVRLDCTRFLVLDEADQMLDLGFIHPLRKLAGMIGTNRQTTLFSATMPKQMAELSAAFLTDPIRIEVAPPGKAADKVSQSIYFVNQGDKSLTLLAMLQKNPNDRTLVFSRTKHGAEKLKKFLVSRDVNAESVHGNKSQGQRDRAIKAFKSGEATVLVATDVAARGIDIPDVRFVFNYDMPEVPENYIHRIGRTARAGADGQAIAFCAPAEAKQLRGIEKLMKSRIPVAGGTAPEGELPAAKPNSRRRRNRSGPPSDRPQSAKPKRRWKAKRPNNNHEGQPRKSRPQTGKKSA